MSPIWRAFELVGAGARTLPHWENGLGVADLALLRPYLTPLPERATTAPCERTIRGCGCRYRIVEHEDATLIGICDEGRCEQRDFTAAELVLYGFNEPKLAASLATALGLTTTDYAALTARADLVKIATFSGEDGRTAPVVLVRTRDPEAALDKLALQLSAKPILLFPSAANLTPVVEARLHRYGWPYRVLENLLLFRPAGIMATEGAAEAIAEMAETLVGEIPPPALAIPTGTRWGEVTLTFNSFDNHVATVQVRGMRQRITPQDLGLQDGRTKGPDQQWLFLKALAECGGHFGWSDTPKHAANKKSKLRLSQALRRAFGIANEPIAWRKEDKAWVTEFSISLK
jgi:hypothetical protein